ncbi:hypothetical protein QJQ45_000502 [Haematococcus lacustris]|nr:hypothetical protein QJQ45_000502 [Haematococcus lacustris]
MSVPEGPPLGMAGFGTRRRAPMPAAPISDQTGLSYAFTNGPAVPQPQQPSARPTPAGTGTALANHMYNLHVRYMCREGLDTALVTAVMNPPASPTRSSYAAAAVMLGLKAAQRGQTSCSCLVKATAAAAEAPPSSAAMAGRDDHTLMVDAGLFFNSKPSLGFGLVQLEGGPCGVLAGVQAHVLANLQHASGAFNLQPSVAQQHSALAAGLADLLWAARSGPTALVAQPMPETGVRPSALGYDAFMRCVVTHSAATKSALQDLLLRLLPSYMEATGWGLLLLLLSLLLTRGPATVRVDMDEANNALMGMHGYCSAELVNLILTGQAVSNVFDGNQDLDGSLLKGVTRRCRLGLLTLFEWYKYVEVGRSLKSPELPIWVVCSESHFTVLFSQDRRALSGSLPFDLMYYDELANQDDLIHLSVNHDPQGGWTRRVGDSFGDRGKCEGQNIPPLECVIETRWPGVKVSWNGSDPILQHLSLGAALYGLSESLQQTDQQSAVDVHLKISIHLFGGKPLHLQLSLWQDYLIVQHSAWEEAYRSLGVDGHMYITTEDMQHPSSATQKELLPPHPSMQHDSAYSLGVQNGSGNPDMAVLKPLHQQRALAAMAGIAGMAGMAESHDGQEQLDYTSQFWSMMLEAPVGLTLLSLPGQGPVLCQNIASVSYFGVLCQQSLGINKASCRAPSHQDRVAGADVLLLLKNLLQYEQAQFETDVLGALLDDIMNTGAVWRQVIKVPTSFPALPWQQPGCSVGDVRLELCDTLFPAGRQQGQSLAVVQECEEVPRSCLHSAEHGQLGASQVQQHAHWKQQAEAAEQALVCTAAPAVPQLPPMLPQPAPNFMMGAGGGRRALRRMQAMQLPSVSTTHLPSTGNSSPVNLTYPPGLMPWPACPDWQLEEQEQAQAVQQQHLPLSTSKFLRAACSLSGHAWGTANSKRRSDQPLLQQSSCSGAYVLNQQRMHCHCDVVHLGLEPLCSLIVAVAGVSKAGTGTFSTSVHTQALPIPEAHSGPSYLHQYDNVSWPRPMPADNTRSSSPARAMAPHGGCSTVMSHSGRLLPPAGSQLAPGPGVVQHRTSIIHTNSSLFDQLLAATSQPDFSGPQLSSRPHDVTLATTTTSQVSQSLHAAPPSSKRAVRCDKATHKCTLPVNAKDEPHLQQGSPRADGAVVRVATPDNSTPPILRQVASGRAAGLHPYSFTSEASSPSDLVKRTGSSLGPPKRVLSMLTALKSSRSATHSFTSGGPPARHQSSKSSRLSCGPGVGGDHRASPYPMPQAEDSLCQEHPSSPAAHKTTHGACHNNEDASVQVPRHCKSYTQMNSQAVPPPLSATQMRQELQGRLEELSQDVTAKPGSSVSLGGNLPKAASAPGPCPHSLPGAADPCQTVFNSPTHHPQAAAGRGEEQWATAVTQAVPCPSDPGSRLSTSLSAVLEATLGASNLDPKPAMPMHSCPGPGMEGAAVGQGGSVLWPTDCQQASDGAGPWQQEQQPGQVQPGDGTSEEGEGQAWSWHEVELRRITDPDTGRHALLLSNRDVTERAHLENMLSELMEAQLSLLSHIFPRHLFMPCPSPLPHCMFSTAAGWELLRTDLCGFTEMSKLVPAEAVISFINRLFTAWDKAIAKHGLQKIDTLGDAVRKPYKPGLANSISAPSTSANTDAHAATESPSMNSCPVFLQIIVSSGILAADEDGFLEVDTTQPPEHGARKILAFAQDALRVARVTCPLNHIQLSDQTASLLAGCSTPEALGLQPTGGVYCKGKGTLLTWLWAPPAEWADEQQLPPGFFRQQTIRSPSAQSPQDQPTPGQCSVVSLENGEDEVATVQPGLQADANKELAPCKSSTNQALAAAGSAMPGSQGQGLSLQPSLQPSCHQVQPATVHQGPGLTTQAAGPDSLPSSAGTPGVARLLAPSFQSLTQAGSRDQLGCGKPTTSQSRPGRAAYVSNGTALDPATRHRAVTWSPNQSPTARLQATVPSSSASATVAHTLAGQQARHALLTMIHSPGSFPALLRADTHSCLAIPGAGLSSQGSDPGAHSHSRRQGNARPGLGRMCDTGASGPLAASPTFVDGDPYTDTAPDEVLEAKQPTKVMKYLRAFLPPAATHRPLAWSGGGAGPNAGNSLVVQLSRPSRWQLALPGSRVQGGAETVRPSSSNSWAPEPDAT